MERGLLQRGGKRERLRGKGLLQLEKGTALFSLKTFYSGEGNGKKEKKGKKEEKQAYRRIH